MELRLTLDMYYNLPMYMCRSKRPGLIRAGSRISTRLVPAKTTTFVLLLNPVMKKTNSIQRCRDILHRGRKRLPNTEKGNVTAYHPFPQVTGWACFLARSGHRSSPCLSSCPLRQSRQWKGCMGHFFEPWQTYPLSNKGQSRHLLSCFENCFLWCNYSIIKSKAKTVLYNCIFNIAMKGNIKFTDDVAKWKQTLK